MFAYIVNNRYLAKITSSILNFIFSVYRKLITKNRNQKVLIVAIHKIGDSVFTLPAIKKTASIYGDNISILCSSNVRVIFEKFLPDTEIRDVDILDDFYLNRIAKPKVRKIVKEVNPGIIFDITGNIKSATAIINSRAGIISGFNEREHFRELYSHFVEKRITPKLRDLYFGPIAAVNNISITEKEIIFPINLNPEGDILIHPFAGWRAKEWGFSKFIELAAKLNSCFLCKFVGRQEDFLPKQLALAEKNKIPVIFSADLELLMAEIEKCSLFISNDSGPLYIANMLGKPTFTIYGPTNPEYSLPDGKFNRYIQKVVDCSPVKNSQYCFTNAGRNGCPYFKCMEELDVETVLGTIQNFVIEEQILKTQL